MTLGQKRDRDGSPTLVHREALGLFALLLPLLWLAPSLARGQSADSLVVQWTAPGDDGMSGTAAYYELRIATTLMTGANFASALIVPGTPGPAPAGSRESFVVRGLVRGTTYWLGLRTMDDAGNWSGVSNIVRFDWPPDAAPPAAPAGVAAEQQPGSATVRVSWSPNAEPDLAGYRVHRATSSSGPWQVVASAGAAATEWTDTQLPQGADALWYAVSAYDVSGAEGARSASAHLVLGSGLPAAPAAWGIQPAYPNPARLGAPMRIPVAIPPGGGAARLELLDSSGRLVRRFELGGSPGGVRELVWDGRNESGRECAPGVYRALLEAPGYSRSIFVARVP